MPPLALIVLIESIIQLTPEAIQLWKTIRPMLEQGRELTEGEWAVIDAQADAAHNAAQV